MQMWCVLFAGSLHASRSPSPHTSAISASQVGPPWAPTLTHARSIVRPPMQPSSYPAGQINAISPRQPIGTESRLAVGVGAGGPGSDDVTEVDGPGLGVDVTERHAPTRNRIETNRTIPLRTQIQCERSVGRLDESAARHAARSVRRMVARGDMRSEHGLISRRSCPRGQSAGVRCPTRRRRCGTRRAGWRPGPWPTGCRRSASPRPRRSPRAARPPRPSRPSS